MAMRERGWKDYLKRTCAINLQTLLFGYSIAFTGTTLGAMLLDVDADCTTDDSCYSLASGRIVGMMSALALVGSLLSGPLADLIGRRTVLTFNCVLWIIGYTLMWNAISVQELILARSIQGFAVGTTGVVCPMYNAEISPVRLRGKLGCVFNIELAIGILLANALGTLCQQNPMWWRTLACIGNVPAVLSLGCLIFMLPESPIFCQLHGQDEKAAQILQDLHGSEILIDTECPQKTASSENLIDTSECPQQTASFGTDSSPGKKGDRVLSRGLFSNSNRRGVLTAVGVTCCFVLTGNNILLAFLSDILKNAGASITFGTIMISVSQVVASIIMAAYIVEAYGRRPLLLYSSVGSALSMFGMAFFTSIQWGNGTVIMATIYIVCVTFGLSTLSWVYAAEVVPSAVRGQGMACCSVLFWIITYAQTSYYYDYEPILGEAGVFLCYGGLCCLSGIFIHINAHETKGLSLVQIEELFANGGRKKSRQPKCDGDEESTLLLTGDSKTFKWCGFDRL